MNYQNDNTISLEGNVFADIEINDEHEKIKANNKVTVSFDEIKQIKNFLLNPIVDPTNFLLLHLYLKHTNYSS